MSSDELQIFFALQRSICELLIYVNRTAMRAKHAALVAEQAAEMLQNYGLVPAEVPTVRKESRV